MHIDNRKEQLYRAAFKLFLTRQFEGVTITDIEEAAGMTRGAITYYSKNKRGLFKDVIRHYLIDKQNINYKINPDQPTFFAFIDAFLEGVKQTMGGMQRLIDELTPKNASQSYLLLLMQLKMYFPDLHDEYLINRNNEMSLWNMKIIQGIERGELRKDLDVMTVAQQFVFLFYGEAFYESLLSELDVEQLRRIMYGLYRLIKAPESNMVLK